MLLDVFEWLCVLIVVMLCKLFGCFVVCNVDECCVIVLWCDVLGKVVVFGEDFCVLWDCICYCIVYCVEFDNVKLVCDCMVVLCDVLDIVWVWL